jgi:uncharacterized membrane protein
MEYIPTLVGYVLFILAACHAWLDAGRNRFQRMLMLLTLFGFGTLIEFIGVSSGNYAYPREAGINMGVVPMSVSLAWVGIIYSVMIIAERLEYPWYLRILATTLIAISLDWGMDPIAVHIGAWTWSFAGAYFGVPGFNFFGWFFIPIAYLAAYGLAWDRPRQQFRLLNIQEIDADPSVSRKMYTWLGVIPLSLVLLMTATVPLSKIPILYNMPWLPLVIWAVLSVSGASGLILARRDRLGRAHGYDLIPPAILTYIGLNYALFGFATGRPDLGWIMALAGMPLWLALIFTLIRKNTKTGEMKHV